MQKRHFDHERLKVYQMSIELVGIIDQLLESVPKSLAVYNQLDRASTSIPLNIAEGNGKYTAADRCRFFDIARGSALECAACLDVLIAKRQITDANQTKDILIQIVSMLVGMIKSNSSSRVHEASPVYASETNDITGED